MSKPKSYHTLYINEIGEEVIFDGEAFKECFDNEEAEINRNRFQKRGGQSCLLKILAKELYPDQSPTESAKTIKQWVYGNNGPSCLEDIVKLEAHYNRCFRTVRIPKYLKNKEKDADTKVINEISAAEQSAARELYHIMADLIRIHQKLMFNYWHAGMPSFPAAASHPYIPDNYPFFADIYHTIIKIGFDLPIEVRNDTIRLAKDIYGPINDAADAWGDEVYPEIGYDLELYEDYWGHPARDEDHVAWFAFINEQAKSYYNILDLIFQAYRR